MHTQSPGNKVGPVRHACRVAGLAVIGVVMGLSIATAQDFGDVAAGHGLAETWCSGCHLVSPSSRGPVPDGVPGFPAVANMSSTTAISLGVFLQTRHGAMPDFKLSREQIADVSAYILSLRK